MNKLSINRILSKFSSKSTVGNYNTLLINGAIGFINNIYQTKLVNLNKIEDKFRNYSWYLDKSSGDLYHIMVKLDDNHIQSLNKDNMTLLYDLKKKKYSEIILEMDKINRNRFLKDSFLYKFSIDSNEGREHFSINNFFIKKINITLKRKRDESMIVRRIRSKSEDQTLKWVNMISASKVRNYLLNDPLLDWLSEYNITSIHDNPKGKVSNTAGVVNYQNVDDFTKFIMNQGIEFENEVYKIIKKKFNVIKVAESYEAKNEFKFKKTIKLMKEGIDILYQPVLQDFTNNVYGCPDLLVRSDKINEIFDYEVIEESEKYIKNNKLGTPFYYFVVDIKHSTLELNSDGKTMRNSHSIPAYKGQLYVYNLAIGNLQGYQPKKSFILGKKWKYKKRKNEYSGTNFMNKLGEIHYEGVDNFYKTRTLDALEWLRDVRLNGHKWKLFPFPDRKELFPNMKNEKDGQWRRLKFDLDKKLKEITSVWHCGIKHRNIAHSKSIYSWNDKRCTTKNMGFKKSNTSETVDSILKINRQSRKMIDLGSLNKSDSWHKNDDNLEFYLDFETMNSNIGKCIVNENSVGYNDNQFIFLIGLGWEENNEWKFKHFLANENSLPGEFKMVTEFWNFINKKVGDKKPIFYHWTKAEPSSYKKMLLRHNNLFKNLNFYDLYDLFLKNKIVVKGSLKFRLKSIAKAMYENKMIKTSWDSESPCSNGLKAMLLAHNLYEKYGIVDEKEPIMTDIIYYNEVDCKVLWEILLYLRTLKK